MSTPRQRILRALDSLSLSDDQGRLERLAQAAERLAAVAGEQPKPARPARPLSRNEALNLALRRLRKI
jgi:hypothetical protein